MNTYTWLIPQLECTPSVDGQTNVVSTVHWRINATDGTNTAEIYGTQSLTFDPENDFISYSDLTKNTVIKWVQKRIGADNIIKLQETLDKKLEALANPPIITPPLPWSE